MLSRLTRITSFCSWHYFVPLLLWFVISSSSPAQTTHIKNCNIFRASSSGNIFHGAAIVAANSFDDNRIIDVVHSCVRTYSLFEKELVFIVFGSSLEDVLSVFRIDKPLYVTFDQWERAVLRRRKPEKLAIFVEIHGLASIRIINSGKLSNYHLKLKKIDQTSEDSGDLYINIVNSIRQAAISVESKERIEVGSYFHEGKLNGVSIYISGYEFIENPEKTLTILRQALSGGELSVYISSAPCFRNSRSFPYLDLEQTATGRCTTEPSYGAKVVFCTSSPAGDYRSCRSIEPLSKRE